MIDQYMNVCIYRHIETGYTLKQVESLFIIKIGNSSVWELHEIVFQTTSTVRQKEL